MTETNPWLIDGTFILRAVYPAGARDDGHCARRYRGRLIDCVRVYARTLAQQPAGVGVDCWMLGANGTFEPYPGQPPEGEAWSHPPSFPLDPIGTVEDLGPVDPPG